MARSFAIAAALVLVLAACGDSAGVTTTASAAGDPPPETSPPVTEAPPLTTPPDPVETPDTAPKPEPGRPAAEARADLAARLGVAVDEVTVAGVEQVTWRDGSLGCPQPGMAYTQALVDGVRVVLEAGGQTYHYHAGGNGAAFYCADPQEPLPRDGG